MKTVKTPIRTCIGCRCKFPQNTLIRIVCHKGESLEIQALTKLPGRGAYVCRSTACIQEAFKVPKRINALLRVQLPKSVINEFKQTVLDKEINANE
jgi:predicted RNA-binding protein YlxR (DUF448 family)